MPERRPVTAPSFAALKGKGDRLVVVTAYDFPSARLADEAGVDAILVGDSLGMVVLGYDSTVNVTMDDMVHHVRAVARAKPKALVIGDLPFLSFQASEAEAFHNAARIIQAGAGAVKVEGAGSVIPTIRRLVESGVPVMGHLGLTPQSVLGLGGFKVQGKTVSAASRLLKDAKALADAGVFGIVLEAVPTEVSRVVTQEIGVPTIGIGAGPDCDGEVQVWHDLLGLAGDFRPRHARCFAEVGEVIREAIGRYAAEVRGRSFPGEEQTFHQPELKDASKWK